MYSMFVQSYLRKPLGLIKIDHSPRPPLESNSSKHKALALIINNP